MEVRCIRQSEIYVIEIPALVWNTSHMIFDQNISGRDMSAQLCCLISQEALHEINTYLYVAIQLTQINDIIKTVVPNKFNLGYYYSAKSLQLSKY